MVRALAIAVTAGALLPASAGAATYCVQTTSCPAGGLAKDTLTDAVTAANADSEPAEIRIGPVEVAAAASAITQQVTIIGAGRNRTLVSGEGDGPAAFRLDGPGSRISDLAIRMGGGNSGGGVTLDGGVAERIDIRAPSGTRSGRGIDMVNGGSLSDSSVLQGRIGTAILASASNGQTVALSDVSASGATALVESTEGTGRLVGQRLDLNGFNDGVSTTGNGGRIDLSSSLVRGSRYGIQNQSRVTGGEDHPMTLSGVTVVGSNEEGSAGIESRAGFGRTSNVTVRDTTVTGFASSLRRVSQAFGDPPGTANIAISYSNYSTIAEPSGGGAATLEAGNVNVDPGFVSAASGDYSLSSTSLLIDAGSSASPLLGASATDLGSLPRKVDGNGDGVAVSDIGAFERPAPPVIGGSQPGGGSTATTGGAPAAPVRPPASRPIVVRDVMAPAVSGTSVSRSTFAAGSTSTAISAAKTGTDLRYTLSEAATVKIAVQRRATGARVRQRGKRVCAKRTSARSKAARCTRWETVRTLARKGSRGRNTVAFTGRIGGRKLAPGRYRFSIVATDATGNRAAARTVAFRIVR